MKPRNVFALARRADLFKALEKLFPRDEAKPPPKPFKPIITPAREGRWDIGWGKRPSHERQERLEAARRLTPANQNEPPTDPAA